MTNEEIIRAIRHKLPVKAEIPSGGSVIKIYCERITEYVLWIDRYGIMQKSVNVIESTTGTLYRVNADRVSPAGADLIRKEFLGG